MTAPEIIIAAVATVSLIAGRWNATATFLALEWMASETIWLITDDNLPIGAFWLMDLTVLALIYARTPLPIESYATGRKQATAFWRELGRSDRVVVAIFGAMWVVYAVPMSDWPRWSALYALTLTQFIVAIGGAVVRRSGGPRRGQPKSDADNVTMLAWGGGGG